MQNNQQEKKCCEKCLWTPKNDKHAINDCTNTHCHCHAPSLLAQHREEEDKVFDKKFSNAPLSNGACPIHGTENIDWSDEGLPYNSYDFCSVCADEDREDAPELEPSEKVIKAYIHSREEALLERVKKAVDGMNGLNMPGMKLQDLNGEEYVKKSDVLALLTE